MIVHRKDGWYVISHATGKSLGGPYGSREQAARRLAQVRAFKYMKKSAAVTWAPFSFRGEKYEFKINKESMKILRAKGSKEERFKKLMKAGLMKEVEKYCPTGVPKRFSKMK